MLIQECGAKDRGAILDILNDAILHTTALYDYTPRSLSDISEIT